MLINPSTVTLIQSFPSKAKTKPVRNGRIFMKWIFVFHDLSVLKKSIRHIKALPQ